MMPRSAEIIPLHRGGVRPIPREHIQAISDASARGMARESCSPTPAPLYHTGDVLTQMEEDGRRFANAAAFCGLLVGLVIGVVIGAGLEAFAQWLVETVR